MAVNVISIKCPSCGADLSVESEREFAFCSYCGTKVMINNDNEHIYRTIDEAGIKKAETDRIIKLRQLELEEKSNISQKTAIIIWVAVMIVLMAVGIIGCAVGNDDLGMCFIFAMLVGIYGYMGFFMRDNKKKRPVIAGVDEVVISEAMGNYHEKNFNSIVLLFKSAGFANVTAIPLHDLNVFNMKKNGQVEEVTINGSDEFEEGDVYPKASNVLVTYHCK